MTSHRVFRHGTVAIGLLLAAASTAGAQPVGDVGQFYKGETLKIRSGEERTGDLYAFSGSTSVAGHQDGDLVVWSGSVLISGHVEGDVWAAGGTVTITGTIGDSTRTFSGATVVSGSIDGDLMGFGGSVVVQDTARIAGHALLCAGEVALHGTIDGQVRAIGGEVWISGTIAGDVYIEADVIHIEPGARLLGDLIYESRRELELPSENVVAGEVRFTEKVDDNDGSSPWSTLLWTVWSALAAVLVGSVAIALFRAVVPAVVERIDEEALVGAFLGFGAFLVIPAAAVIVALAVVTIPLSLIALVLLTLAFYLAKIPVAIWLGQRLLGWAGQAAPSPYLALVAGTVLLYAVFALPYLGALVWFGAAWLGMGTMILALRRRVAGSVDRPSTPVGGI